LVILAISKGGAHFARYLDELFILCIDRGLRLLNAGEIQNANLVGELRGESFRAQLDNFVQS
jgi:hypothetical protein